RERHGFAADLGKPFQSALDREVALFVDRDDVAGVVPAAFHWLDHAGLLRLEVAEHHVWSLDEKPPGIVDTFDRIEPRLHLAPQLGPPAGGMGAPLSCRD